MRPSAPFRYDDLEELHTELFSRADRVVPMRDVYKGDMGERVIGLRHDVDDNVGSFDTALKLAEWEFEHGYSSTYFLLHDSYYWRDDKLAWVPRFEELGHEVGIHVNALAESLRQDKDPAMILARALHELRDTGVRVVGSVAHGDPLCHKAFFVNDEMFEECRRPDCGHERRTLTVGSVSKRIAPLPLRVFDLEYDANWLPRADYLSDSGGNWSQPFDIVVQHFGHGQLHMLQHPDWWGEAFVSEEVAA